MIRGPDIIGWFRKYHYSLSSATDMHYMTKQILWYILSHWKTFLSITEINECIELEGY